LNIDFSVAKNISEMGGVHSRRTGPAKIDKFRFRVNPLAPSKGGYFILSLKTEKIKVVNADTSEITLLSQIIRKHVKILSEGWERHMTWTFQLASSGRQTRIQIVADVLLTLFQSGWDPMTPLDMGLQLKDTNGNGKSGPQVTICFKRKEDSLDQDSLVSASRGSISDPLSEHCCLCLETYGSNYLGFHNISNTTLHEIVTSIQTDWLPGLMGVSSGVSSVISDYIVTMPPTLPADSSVLNQKYIQLEGNPWTSEDVRMTHKLQMCLIACLLKEGYKLCMDVNIDASSRVFFFIKKTEDLFGEVLVPDMAGISINKENRPVVLRSKSSFFRTYKGKGRNLSMKKRIRESMRRQNPATNNNQGLRYKPQAGNTAWWQQTSTDMSSDHEEELAL